METLRELKRIAEPAYADNCRVFSRLASSPFVFVVNQPTNGNTDRDARTAGTVSRYLEALESKGSVYHCQAEDSSNLLIVGRELIVTRRIPRIRYSGKHSLPTGSAAMADRMHATWGDFVCLGRWLVFLSL